MANLWRPNRYIHILYRPVTLVEPHTAMLKTERPLSVLSRHSTVLDDLLVGMGNGMVERIRVLPPSHFYIKTIPINISILVTSSVTNKTQILY